VVGAVRIDIDGRRRHEVRIDGLARALLLGSGAIIGIILVLCFVP